MKSVEGPVGSVLVLSVFYLSTDSSSNNSSDSSMDSPSMDSSKDSSEDSSKDSSVDSSMSGDSTTSNLFQLPGFDFDFNTADFEMELGIVSRLFDLGLADAASEFDSEDERVNMRDRGPRAARVKRYPYKSRLYTVYIKHADEHD